MILKAIIILLSAINIGFVYYFWETFVNSDDELKYYYLITILLLESIIILHSIKVFFEDPILELELIIKKLLSWKLKDEKIVFKNVENRNSQHIINRLKDGFLFRLQFFQRYPQFSNVIKKTTKKLVNIYIKDFKVIEWV